MKYNILSFLFFLFFSSCHQDRAGSNEPPLTTEADSLFQVIYIDTLSEDSKRKAINTIETYLNNRDNDSTRRRNHLKIANRYYYLNDFDGFYTNANQALKLGKAANDTLIIARAHYYFGEYYAEFKNLDSAYYHYNKAYQYYDITKDYNTQSNVLIKLSILYKDVKDYPNSEKTLVEALRIIEKEKNPLLKYGVYNTMGKLLMDLGKYEEAIDYHKKALALVNDFDNYEHYKKRLSIQSLINIGVTYMDKREYNKALQYFNSAFEMDKIYMEYPLNYAYLLQNLSYTRHKLGELNIMPQFKEALRIQDSMGYTFARVSNELVIAKYYLEISKLDSSYFFAQKAYATAAKEGLMENKLEALYLLANTDEVKKSNLWYEAYIALQDSITEHERKQRDKFALIAYDTENLKIEKAFAEAENEKLLIQLWGIVIISILLLSVIFIAFKSRSNKLKAKELMLKHEEQKTKEKFYRLMLDEQAKIEEGKNLEKKRISRELHDGILGKLSGIRLNLFVLQKKKDPETIEKCLPYIGHIQEVEKEIRAISHNLSSDFFSEQIHFTQMVRTLIEESKMHSDISYNLVTDELIPWQSVSSDIKVDVYRILQEAIHNIEKHSKAQNVIISIQKRNKNIRVRITDDGIGVLPKKNKQGIGMKNMQERAQKHGAELIVEAISGKGTSISLDIPFF